MGALRVEGAQGPAADRSLKGHPLPSTPVRRRLASVLCVSLLVGAAVSLPLAASAAEPAAAAKAATWLAGDLSGAGTVVGSYPGDDGQDVVFTDYGRSLDATIALLTAGGHDDVAGRTLTTLTTPGSVAAYTQGAPFDKAGSAYAGATAKLAYVVKASGGDPTAVGGTDLLVQLQSLVGSDGRLKDRSDFGDYANAFGQSFAVLALQLNGRSTGPVVQGLLGVQCGDGSFPEAFVPKTGQTCKGSVDATGLALQALAAVGQTNAAATQSAKSWLLGQQKADGSFPGEAPVNSTGYAASGLAAVGASTDSAAAYLATQQNADGGLRRGAGTVSASDAFATAQALPALLGRAFPTASRTVARQAIPCATAAVTLPSDTITATAKGVVTMAATSGTQVDLYAYSRPSTDYAVVRSVTVGKGGTVGVTVAPGTNTRLYAKQVGCDAGSAKVLNVRTALTIAVKRNGARDYTFSGDSLPARAAGLIVSVYRLTSDGPVLTAQARADGKTGGWSVRRTFTGTGRFDFVVRTGQDLQNAPGTSNTRSLLVF